MKINLKSKNVLPASLLISMIIVSLFFLKPTLVNNYHRLISYYAVTSCSECPDPSNCTVIPSLNNGLCDRLVNSINTIGDVDCSLTADSSTNFKTATPNFVTSNGQRFFNFGSNADANGMYTFYIDIDGKKSRGVLNIDVLAFNVYKDGMVYPVKDSIGANDIEYLSVNVKETSTNGAVLLRNVTYREGLCKANLAPTLEPTYCDGTGFTAITPQCDTVGACEITLNKSDLVNKYNIK
jgi:hypothetical protein